MQWLESWPVEYHRLMKEIASQMGLEKLYLKSEISGLSGLRTFRVAADTAHEIANPIVLKIGGVKRYLRKRRVAVRL